MNKVIGYVRVSTDKQDISPAAQIKKITGYCDLYGLTLVDILIDEGVSASIPFEDRPAGSQLRHKIGHHHAHGIVAVCLDRLFRRALNGLMTAENFRKNRIDLHLVDEKIDTSTSDGWLFLTIKLGIAENELNKIGERTKTALTHLRATGRAFGHAPFGTLRVDNAEGKGELFINKADWDIREMIVGWHKHFNYSLQRICNELRNQNIFAPNGKRTWHKSTVRGIINTHASLIHLRVYEV